MNCFYNRILECGCMNFFVRDRGGGGILRCDLLICYFFDRLNMFGIV